MVSKKIIDLLSEDEDLELPDDMPLGHIDSTFVPHHNHAGSGPETAPYLSTKKKFHILDWVSIDEQIRRFSRSRVDTLSLNFISENDIKHIIFKGSEGEFDFSSDSIPFAVKYNIAMALSFSSAIEVLSSQDACEIYPSEEVKRIFEKHNVPIEPGLNIIKFGELPLDMKKELIWPMVQNLYRALTVRKAAQAFPEGVPGELAYEALMSECKNEWLSKNLSEFPIHKYDYKRVFFSDLSDLEIKYHIASYCLDHIGEIKSSQNPQQKVSAQEPTESMDEQKQKEILKELEEEYISAFKRLNRNKSFWDNINLEDLFEMGKDVISAIKEEVRNFAKLKQEIKYRLAGRSKVAIEDEELLRIVRGRNPNFGIASQYLNMFLQPSDYYAILGLNNTKTLTEKEIKDAFKKQAKIYHPDKNPNDPFREEKELRFKLLIEAKNALLKRSHIGKERISGFHEGLPLTSYLGNISELFVGLKDSETTPERAIPVDPYRLEDKTGETQEREKVKDKQAKMEVPPTMDRYLGPYFEEMSILESMIGKDWTGKNVLVLGAGPQPNPSEIPVILSRMGANVSAIDVNYRGPEVYEGCRYYRISVDGVDQAFAEEQFDIIISTGLFGVPFTNWAIRQYALNPFSEDLKDRIKELELEIFKKLIRLTKKGGWHFHYNKDLNPQSWNFTEDELRQIGYSEAFHPQNLASSSATWFLRA